MMTTPETAYRTLRQLGKACLRFPNPIEKSNLFPRMVVPFVLDRTYNPSTSSARPMEERRVGESPWTLPLCRLWLPSSS